MTVQKPIHKEIRLEGQTSGLAKLRKTIEDVAGQAFVDHEAHQIALAVDEAVANIIKHAYQENEGPKRLVAICVDLNPNRLEVSIRDQGKSFDPESVPDLLDIEDHVKKGRKNGLGIFLMRRIMDEVNYSFLRGVHNELRLVKYIDSPHRKAKNG